MNKYQILYEYTYYFHKGYTFKKQICINNNKKIIFNFIVGDSFCDDLLLTNFNNDFNDDLLKNKIKDFLLIEIKWTIKVKTLGMCFKDIKCDVEKLEDGIKINDKVFRLKDDDYDDLEYKTLEYIKTLKQ